MELEEYYKPYMVGKKFGCINQCTLDYFIENIDTSLELVEEMARVAVLPSLIDRCQRYAFIDCLFTLNDIESNAVASRYLKMPGFFKLQQRKKQMLWTMREASSLKSWGVAGFIEEFGVNPESTTEFGDTTRTQRAIESRYEKLTAKPIADKSSSVPWVNKGLPTWFVKDHSAGVDYCGETRPNAADLRVWRSKVDEVDGADIVLEPGNPDATTYGPAESPARPTPVKLKGFADVSKPMPRKSSDPTPLGSLRAGAKAAESSRLDKVEADVAKLVETNAAILQMLTKLEGKL